MVLGEQFVAFVCKTRDGDVFRNSLTLWTCGLQGNLKLFGLGPLPTIFSNYEKCYVIFICCMLFFLCSHSLLRKADHFSTASDWEWQNLWSLGWEAAPWELELVLIRTQLRGLPTVTPWSSPEQDILLLMDVLMISWVPTGLSIQNTEN